MRKGGHSFGTFPLLAGFFDAAAREMRQANVIASEAAMNGLIYLVGLIVIIMFVLSLLGLR